MPVLPWIHAKRLKTLRKAVGEIKKLLVTVFAVGVCFSIGIYLWQSSRTSPIPDIAPGRLQQMIDDGDNFYVYFYAPDCTECLATRGNLFKAVKDLKITNIVAIDVKKYDYLVEQLQIPGTPSIYVYRNHKMVKGITGGFKRVEEYKTFFTKTGVDN